jgi:hypothetical protein
LRGGNTAVAFTSMLKLSCRMSTDMWSAMACGIPVIAVSIEVKW